MSKTDSISIDEALGWFELDSETINVEKVSSAYKRLALAHHPDRKYNFKEKSLAHDKFIYTRRAKDVLEDALRTGCLPRFDSTSAPEVDERNKYGPTITHAEDAPRKTAPHWLGEKRLSDYLFDIPVLGGLLAIPYFFGFMFMMMGAAILVLPLTIALWLTGKKGEKLLKRLWELASGLPLIPVYLFLGYVSASVFGEGNSIVFWSMIVCSSLAVLLIVIDEVYSMIRYFKKQKAHELSPYNKI
jgi:hypothetical protein